MCGIFGIVTSNGFDDSIFPPRILQHILKQILIESESRGFDSSGLASIDKYCRWKVAKAPFRATDFSKLEDIISFLDNIDGNTRIVIGHTRAGTKGSEYENNNNHPIITKNTIGVHNGVIRNDDELFDVLKIDRIAEVDSEIIFQLIDSNGIDSSISFDLEKVHETIGYLEGSLAIATFRKNNPFEVLLVKRGSPLRTIISKDGTLLIFASELDFIEESVNTINEYADIFDSDFRVEYTDALPFNNNSIVSYRDSMNAGLYTLYNNIVMVQEFNVPDWNGKISSWWSAYRDKNNNSPKVDISKDKQEEKWSTDNYGEDIYHYGISPLFW